eukprot:3562814-Rhodomonas_salina.1
MEGRGSSGVTGAGAGFAGRDAALRRLGRRDPRGRAAARRLVGSGSVSGEVGGGGGAGEEGEVAGDGRGARGQDGAGASTGSTEWEDHANCC